MANKDFSSAQYSLINRNNFAKLSNPDAKLECRHIADALDSIDKCAGQLAFHAAQLYELFASGKLPEAENDFPAFFEHIFGQKRSQCYNLIRAGRFITIGYAAEDEKQVRPLYSDIWSDFKCRPFSNTQLIRFADFIGDAESDTGRARRQFLNEKIQSGEISQLKSIAQNQLILNGCVDPVATVTAKSKKSTKKAQTPAQTPAQNPAQTPAKQSISLSVDEWKMIEKALNPHSKESPFIAMLIDLITELETPETPAQ